jgi:hypothetical protein
MIMYIFRCDKDLNTFSLLYFGMLLSLFFLNSNDFLDENSSDPKLFWSLVKKLMGNVGRSCTMPPLLDTENDILYVDDIDKCNLLNSFFCSISNLDDNNCNPPNLELRTNSKYQI